MTVVKKETPDGEGNILIDVYAVSACCNKNYQILLTKDGEYIDTRYMQEIPSGSIATLEMARNVYNMERK